jgi:hypothetical protein
MFFPDDVNVTKKGLNIPWNTFFKSSNLSFFQNLQQQSGVKKPVFKAKTPRKKPLKSSKERCFQNQDTFSSMQPLPLTTKLTESGIPELIFPNFSIATVPETSKTTESVESYLQNILPQTLSQEQNDVLQTAITLVHSPEKSANTTNFHSQEIETNQASELLMNQFPDHLTPPSMNQDQQKQNELATAMNNSLIAIDTLQNNLINELEKIKAILRDFQKKP